MFLRSIAYLGCLYIIYLYCREILLEHKILLPTFTFLEKFDTAMVLGGGILLGIVLILSKGRFNKWAGISMIIN
jgi:hypothetical protein